MAFLSETNNLLKIEDILPFFTQFTLIDDFKEEICNALEEYNQRIKELKYEMEEETRSADLIRRDIKLLRNKCVPLPSCFSIPSPSRYRSLSFSILYSCFRLLQLVGRNPFATFCFTLLHLCLPFFFFPLLFHSFPLMGLPSSFSPLFSPFLSLPAPFHTHQHYLFIRYGFVAHNQMCDICDYPVLTRVFYLFTCLHVYHADCLKREVRDLFIK